MDVIAAFIAEAEPPETMQPGQSSFNDPSQDAETAAVRAPRLRHDGHDPLGGQTR